ncbi:MAG: hypothetical protein Q8O74_09950 [bacterium]|nr:hypothetical protein [bacterium]
MTWRQAFFKQAGDDYSMFVHLNQVSSAECRQLHYLQMATEKLAKAFLCGPDNIPPKITHIALTKFLKVAKSRPDLRRQLGYETKRAAFVSYIDGLIPFAKKIENLAPEGIDKPNPEYPWKARTGEIIAPVDFKYNDILDRQLEMNKLNKLVSNLFRIGIT